MRSSALAFVLVAALWTGFGPQSLGGPVAAVAVAGTSMTPAIEPGDLVFVRRERSYEVGEVVAYRHPDLGVVLHRIVDREAGRFVLRGDNRSTVDTFQPSREEIVGAAWGRVPNVSAAVRRLTEPGSIALLVLGGMTLAAAGGGGSPRRGGRRGRGSGAGAQRGWAVAFGRFGMHGPHGSDLAALGLLLAAGGTAAVVLVAAQGTTRTSPEPIGYHVAGTLGYAAVEGDAATAGADLRATAEEPPPPVFRRLTNRLPLAFTVEAAAASERGELGELRGTQTLSASIRHQSGATEPLDLHVRVPLVTATDGALRASLDLDGLEAAVARLEDRTGLDGGPYWLDVFAGAEVEGALSGVAFSDSLATSLTFAFDRTLLRLDEGASRPNAHAEGVVTVAVVAPREAALPVAGTLDYGQLRTMGLGGAVAGVLILEVVLAATLVARSADEVSRIRMRHGGSIVAAASSPVLPATLVDVQSVEELASVAAGGQHPIVEVSGGSEVDYLVFEQGLAFRYRALRGRG